MVLVMSLDATTPATRLWLAHHQAHQRDRCVTVRGRHVCRRCSLLYPAATLLTTDSLARLRGVLDKLRVDGEPYELDIEFTRPDGATRWCAARGEAVRDASG